MPKQRTQVEPKQTTSDDQLTREKTAELLGIHEKSIYYLIRRGQLTPHRHQIGRGRGGRKVYFLRSEVEALLEDSSETPTK